MPNIPLPVLGIRFNIDEVDDNSYGEACWKVFWRAVDVKKLSGALLFEGDTFATLRGQENVYCLAIQCNVNILREIQAALESSAEFQKIAALPAFILNELVLREPLLDAGRVDETGTLLGKNDTSQPAFDRVAKERLL